MVNLKKLRNSFRNDRDCPWIQAARWLQPHNHTLAHSTYSPLSSVHHYHLSGNFLMDAQTSLSGQYTPKPLCKSLWKTCEDAAVNDTAYCCPLGSHSHHQDDLRIQEDFGHVLASWSCPKFLRPRTYVMLLLHGLPFVFMCVVMKPWLISCDQPGKETVRVLIVNLCVRESVRTLPKDWSVHPSGSYQKNGNCALTSVGSKWYVLKCDYLAVIISQPVFKDSSNHFWTTLVEHVTTEIS
jgi:hypothetical protein